MSISIDEVRMTLNTWVTGSPKGRVEAAKSKRLQSYAPAVTQLGTRIFFALIVVVVGIGWWYRDVDYISAKDGLGYWLGIVGSVIMLLLLLYPLRKKAKFMRNWGSVNLWFRAHKALGFVGPVLVLYHANFRLHATNSNVALFAMLLVVLSGLVGRFIYVKIHYRYSGEKISLQELAQQFGASKSEMHDEVSISQGVKERLEGFEKAELQPTKGFFHACWRAFTLGRRAAWVQWLAMRDLKRELNNQARRGELVPAMLYRRLRHDRELIQEYLLAVRRVSEFGAYSRIFSWWHILHIPLFVILIVTDIVHVIAVHMY